MSNNCASENIEATNDNSIDDISLKPPSLKKIRVEVIYDEKYISEQLDVFEQNLDNIFEKINKDGSGWKGNKLDWEEIYLPELVKFKDDVMTFLKSLTRNNISISKTNYEKIEETLNKCFSMVLIGDKYFPN